MTKSRRSILMSLTLGALLALVTAEVVSRRIFSFRLAFDPTLREFVFSPGERVRTRLEGDGDSIWSAHGVRRTGLPSGGAPGSIIVLGDSFTESLQVSDAEVYTTLLEARLQENGVRNPVLNLGKSSCSLADYIGFADRHRSLFHPVWTVIQVQESDFTTDAWNSSKVNRSTANFYRDPASGELKIAMPQGVDLAKRSWAKNVSMGMRNASSFIQFAFERIEELQLWVEHEPPLFRAPSPDKHPQKPYSWRDYPVKEELKRLSDAYSGHITILLLSEFDPRTGAASEFEKYLTQEAKEMGISLVTLSSQYPSLLGKGLAPFGFSNGIYNHGHMNPLGHSLAADALFRELMRIYTENGFH